MKICSNCHTSNSDFTIFCKVCGTKLGLLPGSQNSIFKFCTSCGTKLSAEDRFCENCGTPVDLSDDDTPLEDNEPEIPEDPTVPVTEDNTTEDEIDFECYEYLYHHDMQCFFSIEFFDEFGKEDKKTAKKVYDYCLKTFDWFQEEDHEDNSVDEYGFFELRDAMIAGEDFLKLQPTSDWLYFIYNKFKPSGMHVESILDNSCDSYEENYIKIYDVVDGCLENVLSDQLSWGDNFDFFIDSSFGYPFYQNSFKRLFPIFKSKTTGMTYHTCNPLEVHTSDTEDDDWIDHWVSDVHNGDSCYFTFNGAMALGKDGLSTNLLDNIKKFDSNSFDEEPSDVFIENLDDDEGEDWEDFEFVDFEERYE